MPDEHDRLALPGGDVPAHPGRVGWHPRKGQTDGVGPILEKPFNRAHRDVSLECVAVDDRCMTRGRFLGHADASSVRSSIRIVSHFDISAVVLQVHDPPGAAASTRVTSNIDADAGERCIIDTHGLRPALESGRRVAAPARRERSHSNGHGCKDKHGTLTARHAHAHYRRQRWTPTPCRTSDSGLPHQPLERDVDDADLTVLNTHCAQRSVGRRSGARARKMTA